MLDDGLEGLAALFELSKSGTGNAGEVGCTEFEDACPFDSGEGGECGLVVPLAILGLAAHVGDIGAEVAHFAVCKLGEHGIEVGVVSVDVGHFEEPPCRLDCVVRIFGGDKVSELLLGKVEVAQMEEAISKHELCVAEACARSVTRLIDHLSEQDRGCVPVADAIAELGVCDLGDGVVLAAELGDGHILRTEELYPATEFIGGLCCAIERLRRSMAAHGECQQERSCSNEAHGSE